MLSYYTTSLSLFSTIWVRAGAFLACLLGQQQIIVFELDPSREVSVPYFVESLSGLMCAGRNELVTVTPDMLALTWGKIFFELPEGSLNCNSNGFLEKKICKNGWCIFGNNLIMNRAGEAHSAMKSVILLLLLLLLLLQSLFTFAANCSQCFVRRLLLSDTIESYALSVGKWACLFGRTFTGGLSATSVFCLQVIRPHCSCVVGGSRTRLALESVYGCC